MSARMKIPRICSGPDGRSRIDSIEIDFFYDEKADPKGPRFDYGDPSHPIPFSDPASVRRAGRRSSVWSSPSTRTPPTRISWLVRTHLCIPK